MGFSTDKLNFLNKFGLPVENQDFQNLLFELTNISIDKFIFTILFIYYISKKLILELTALIGFMSKQDINFVYCFDENYNIQAIDNFNFRKYFRENKHIYYS